ncbi:MAG: thioredoxin [Hyphomicrobiaceae bacterium]|nr:thioredoxin [Hyphomicrobiaceae bacterium]
MDSKAGGAPGDVIKDVSTASFAKDVIEASKSALVLVDFWAAWCGPCRQLTPTIEKVVRSYGGKVRLAKVNVDENQQLAGQLRVQSIPTVYAFRDGKVVDGFMGALPESQLKAFVERSIGAVADEGDELEAILAEADQAFEAGDIQNAAEIYAAILQQDQENVQALAGLARCYLKSGDLDRAEQTIAMVAPDKSRTAPVESVKAAIALARKAADSGDTAALEANVATNPADHQSRYDLAVALAAKGRKMEAVDHLIDLVRRARTWNEEAARKQLVQLFEAWGPKDPATVEGRKRLSSVLFS